jgi:hypothetical protein
MTNDCCGSAQIPDPVCYTIKHSLFNVSPSSSQSYDSSVYAFNGGYPITAFNCNFTITCENGVWKLNGTINGNTVSLTANITSTCSPFNIIFLWHEVNDPDDRWTITIHDCNQSGGE